MNSLAWYHRLGPIFAGDSDEAAIADVREAAAGLRLLGSRLLAQIQALATRCLSGPAPRLALIGTGGDAATALAGALILKEASKVAAEGYAGGAFRHGPMELAGPGLTAILFGDGSDDDMTIRRLAADLSKTGSIVVSVTEKPYDGAEHIAIAARSQLERMVQGMSVIQQFSVSLARQAGITPGEFRFGQKITSQI
jgi:glucosamine--fructose-6-phosphate aminotransferase (isomerizing)